MLLSPAMTKQKILILIPLILIAVMIGKSWIDILTTDSLATWRNYTAILFFLPLIYLFFASKSIKTIILSTGFFLVVGIFNAYTLTLDVVTETFGIRFGSLQLDSLGFQPWALKIFILYGILNISPLINYYLDYRESKRKVVKK